MSHWEVNGGVNFMCANKKITLHVLLITENDLVITIMDTGLTPVQNHKLVFGSGKIAD